ncbi:hypothetical protein ACFD0L_004493 [Salmonella enterica]
MAAYFGLSAYQRQILS